MKLFGLCDGVLVEVWHGFLVVSDLVWMLYMVVESISYNLNLSLKLLFAHQEQPIRTCYL